MCLVRCVLLRACMRKHVWCVVICSVVHHRVPRQTTSLQSAARVVGSRAARAQKGLQCDWRVLQCNGCQSQSLAVAEWCVTRLVVVDVCLLWQVDEVRVCKYQPTFIADAEHSDEDLTALFAALGSSLKAEQFHENSSKSPHGDGRPGYAISRRHRGRAVQGTAATAPNSIADGATAASTGSHGEGVTTSAGTSESVAGAAADTVVVGTVPTQWSAGNSSGDSEAGAQPQLAATDAVVGDRAGDALGGGAASTPAAPTARSSGPGKAAVNYAELYPPELKARFDEMFKWDFVALGYERDLGCV